MDFQAAVDSGAVAGLTIGMSVYVATLIFRVACRMFSAAATGGGNVVAD